VKPLRILKVPTILVTTAALTLGIAGPAWSTSTVTLAPYAPFPKAALVDVGVSFDRPTHVKVEGVRVSVSRAYEVGLAQVGNLPRSARVTIRLGLFSDAVQNFARKVVLAYAVIFDGVTVVWGDFSPPLNRALVAWSFALLGTCLLVSTRVPQAPRGSSERKTTSSSYRLGESCLTYD
jgi:hypothetical protein